MEKIYKKKLKKGILNKKKYSPITAIIYIGIKLRVKSWTSYILRRHIDIIVGRIEGGVTNHANLEFSWTILPMIILVTLSVPSLRLIYFAELPTYEEEIFTNEYKTRVTGHQWFWNYICDKIEKGIYLAGYTALTLKLFKQNSFDSYLLALEDILAIGGARLLEVDNSIISPLSEKLSFLITSSDVLHAWTIPSLGIKLDAIPGRLSSLSVYPTMSGTYYGQCSEICGIGHGFMPIKLYII